MNTTLILEARRLLDRARLIAEAPAAQTSLVGHAHPSSRMPPGAFTRYSSSTLDACGGRINQAIAAGSDDELRAANAWCGRELDLLQRGDPNRYVESAEQFAERVIASYEGLSAPEVVRREHGTTSVTTVRSIRIARGREARLGRELGGEGPR